MWIVTTLGFFSVVKNTNRNGTVLVRARVREDLERLCASGLINAQARQIYDTPASDYPYRLIVPLEDWVDCAGKLAHRVDYPNFKSEVERVQGYPRAELYHRVWAALRGLCRFQDVPRKRANG